MAYIREYPPPGIGFTMHAYLELFSKMAERLRFACLRFCLRLQLNLHMCGQGKRKPSAKQWNIYIYFFFSFLGPCLRLRLRYNVLDCVARSIALHCIEIVVWYSNTVPDVADCDSSDEIYATIFGVQHVEKCPVP